MIIVLASIEYWFDANNKSGREGAASPIKDKCNIFFSVRQKPSRIVSEVPTPPAGQTMRERAGGRGESRAQTQRKQFSNFSNLWRAEKKNQNGTTSVEPEKYYDGPSGDGVDKFDIRQTRTGGYKYILVIWAKSPWAKWFYCCPQQLDCDLDQRYKDSNIKTYLLRMRKGTYVSLNYL